MSSWDMEIRMRHCLTDGSLEDGLRFTKDISQLDKVHQSHIPAGQKRFDFGLRRENMLAAPLPSE